MASREQAVRDKVRASGILNPPPVTVVGIGLQASLVQVSPSRNLDQVVTEIILSGQPPLTSVLSTLVGTIAALGQKPNWKLATCALAGALGKEHGEAIYHHTVAAFPNETKNVLSQAGTLQTLEAMIA
jgi:hypothetical protein